MAYKIASRGVATKDYPISYAFTGSSRSAETDISEMLDQIFLDLIMQRSLILYQSLLLPFKIDLSSVHPHFESVTRTSLIEEFYEGILPEEILEYDIVVRIPPRKRYTIELEVKGIKKAEPKIVEPEWI